MKYLTGNDQNIALEYISVAAQVAKSATCNCAHCGSVVVKDGVIIGKGFNSPPNNLENQRRCDRSKDIYDPKVTDKTCCIHAEQRAIFDALTHNPTSLVGSTLYFTRINKKGAIVKSGRPYCTICSKSALDVGIAEFVLFHEAGICIYSTDEYNTFSYDYEGDNR